MKFLELEFVAQRVKSLLGISAPYIGTAVRVLSTLFPIQSPIEILGRRLKMVQVPLPSMCETRIEFLAHSFSLAQNWLLLPLGE